MQRGLARSCDEQITGTTKHTTGQPDYRQSSRPELSFQWLCHQRKACQREQGQPQGSTSERRGEKA